MRTNKTLTALVLLLAILSIGILYGCGNSTKNEKQNSEVNASKNEVCETCGNTIEGLGWFDDAESGWRPAKESDLVITPICSKACGKRYNRKDGDKPDNWSTKH